jgi:hypothetical protein
MKYRLQGVRALIVTLAATPAMAQDMPDIGFKSVGRGWPLAASVHDLQEVGPVWIRQQGQQVNENTPLNGFRVNALPANITPLPRDLFNSPDFYADKALWNDPRYFRCNSPMGTEVQRGILAPPPVNTSSNVADGPWGRCEHDVPRESIVSPYGFKTAQEHYEALLKETQSRGGPTVTTFKDFAAAEWNGVYERPARAARNQMNWSWGRHMQIPTLLSVLTPEYQQRVVQEAYHQVRGNALWPSTFCWPEGLLRRYYFAAVWEHYIIATPDMVQISAGVAGNFVQNIYVGRQFNMEDVPNGGVPRLGGAVPRWYGETIGFRDGETLITWTSNVQGWKSHSMFEFSNKMQTIEIYTPIRNQDGAFIGLNHESIFYDPEALAEPVRIVRNLHKINNFTDSNQTPLPYIECVQTIYSIKGHNTPVAPGATIEYEVPDMYGRPWDAIWRKYFEEGMSRPDDDEAMFNFE